MHASPIVLLAIGALTAAGLGLILALLARSQSAHRRGLSLLRWGLGVAGTLLCVAALRDGDISDVAGGVMLILLATELTQIGGRVSP